MAAEAFLYYKLCSWGYQAQIAQGPMPYDLWLPIGSNIVKLQVKGASSLCKKRQSYPFTMGKGAKNYAYTREDIDIMGLVALPEERIIFMADFTSKQRCRVQCKKFTEHNEKRTWRNCLEEILGEDNLPSDLYCHA